MEPRTRSSDTSATMRITGPDPRSTSPEGWVTVFDDSRMDGRQPQEGEVVTGVLDDGSRERFVVLVADGPPSMRYYVFGPDRSRRQSS